MMKKTPVAALYFTLVLLLATWAFGAASSPYASAPRNAGSSRAVNLGQLLTDADLDGAAGQRTITITNEAGSFGYAQLEIVRTRSAGTDLTMTCLSTTRESTAPTAQRTTCSFDSSGFCDSLTATRRSTTSVTESLVWTVTVAGYIRTDCVFASTSAGASDQLDIYGSMVGW